MAKSRGLVEALKLEVELLRAELVSAKAEAKSNADRYYDIKIALEDLVDRCELEIASQQKYLWNLQDSSNEWVEFKNAKVVLKSLKSAAVKIVN